MGHHILGNEHPLGGFRLKCIVVGPGPTDHVLVMGAHHAGVRIETVEGTNKVIVLIIFFGFDAGLSECFKVSQ